MIKPLSSMTKNRCFLTKFVRSDPVRQKQQMADGVQ